MARMWLRGGIVALAVAGCTTAAEIPSAPVVTPSVSATPSPSVTSAKTDKPRHRQCFRRLFRYLSVRPGSHTPPAWHAPLEEPIAGRDVSVSVAFEGRFLFDHQGSVERIPASNQKLLLAMALLDSFPTAWRIPTSVAAHVDGDSIGDYLYLYGLGDPTFGDAAYRASLGLRGSTIDRLARQVAAFGSDRIGGVVGLQGPMLGDWNAVGWRTEVARSYLPRPTALSFNGNRASSNAPERHAAAALTERLEHHGVAVIFNPRRSTRDFPRRAATLAGVTSPPLIKLIEIMSRESTNFIAEVLNKRLGARCYGEPGTIASGARTIERWARRINVDVVAHDASGLSYDNRVTTREMVRLLTYGEERPWGEKLRRALPGPGEGTLGSRLAGIRVRAKTGSLFDGTSALSGWVWLEQEKDWAAFSILSSLGNAGPALEDAIVRLLATTASQ